MRKGYPDPLVKIHPRTAEELGIESGDWVVIETGGGSIKQKARISSRVDPRVILADHGWWFPEREKEEMYGWKDSNYNVLTEGDLPGSPEVGSNNIRGFACRVYKEKGA
jgi:anaerobic selenocysteine-containing dehydrogenase